MSRQAEHHALLAGEAGTGAWPHRGHAFRSQNTGTVLQGSEDIGGEGARSPPSQVNEFCGTQWGSGMLVRQRPAQPRDPLQKPSLLQSCIDPPPRTWILFHQL